jgi:hypothetical protein
LGLEKIAYRVDLQIPWLSGSVQVNDNFIIWQTELLQRNVSTMRPGAGVIGIQNDLGSRHDCGRFWLIRVDEGDRSGIGANFLIEYMRRCLDFKCKLLSGMMPRGT